MDIPRGGARTAPFPVLTGQGPSSNILPLKVLKKNEENVSAEQPKTEENARVPRPHEDQGRPRSPQEQTAQGQETRLCRMNERLTPLERIRKKKDFAGLYRDGSRYRGRYFNLVYRSNPLDHSRLAVVVSRKVGSAVERNKVKRRVRDLFRRNKGLLSEPTDLIVVARREIVDLKMSELRDGYFQALDSIRKRRASS